MNTKECISETCECNVVHDNVVERVRATLPDEDLLADVAELFKVFGDSTRTRILSALFGAELCVCDIASLLNMTKSAVSHQLRILRQTKIVKNRKHGKEVYYSLDDDHIAKIYKTALEHLTEENG
ncbi:MAG: helix-turn-helix transcriptional regulator [Clostridia bacterium]|nr:helix-turn-helix transcriptional regulator [Clostridia bacterium]